MDPARVEALEVQLFLEALHRRHGYDLRGYAQPSIHRRVLGLLTETGHDNLGELRHRMLVDGTFLATIIDSLTVQVSDLFRDPEFYRVFREQVVPHLRPYPQIRVWHAGCSSGEEVYSSAILFMEEGLYDRTLIYATDLSAKALARAKEAVYAADRAPAFRANYEAAGGKATFSEYCSEAYQRLAIHESLRRNVFFFQHDLISDHVFGEMQVIFCRNVMLYFGDSARNGVLSKLAQSLCHGGVLILCSAERLPRELTAFEELSAGDRIYRFWSDR
jgi:chemotaxis protein methyltransferase CheR